MLSGASGCGKSTLLSLIAGVVLPQHGTIDILGRRLTDIPTSSRDRFRADHLGLVFQQFNLLPYLDIFDNILLPCTFSALRRQRISKTKSTPRQHAKNLLDQLELDVSQLGKRAVADLSIGQQQRVAVARALIGSPELIIADEPTSALDERAGQSFIELLLGQSSANGSTVLVVSHDTRLASHFDRHIRFETLNQTRAAAA